MADEIEKVVVPVGMSNGGTPLPIAGTDNIGLASFRKEDFLVTKDGEVQALTKYGIAHTVEYRGYDSTARYYVVDTSFGTQQAKVGDVALVTKELVNGTVPSPENANSQLGTIVKFTSIKQIGTPTVFYADVLGDIRGKQGQAGARWYTSQGHWNDTDAAQPVNGYSPSTPTIRAGDYVLNQNTGKVMLMRDSQYGWIVASIKGASGNDGGIQHLVRVDTLNVWTVLLSFTSTEKPKVGESMLVIKAASNMYADQIGNVLRINEIQGNQISSANLLGNIRGRQGKEIRTGYPTGVVDTGKKRFVWRLGNEHNTDIEIPNLGDYIICTDGKEFTYNDVKYSSNRSAMYVIDSVTQIGDGLPVSITTLVTPVVPAGKFTLGVFNLSRPREDAEFLKFDVASIDGSQPYAGAIGLCIDDNASKYYGKFYTMRSAYLAGDHWECTTGTTGSSVVGPEGRIALTYDFILHDNFIVGGVKSISASHFNRDAKIGDVFNAISEYNNQVYQLILGVESISGETCSVRCFGKTKSLVGPQGVQGKEGPQGIPGPAGVANVNARGAYDPSVAYLQNDLVYFDTKYTNEVFGGSYIRNDNLPNQTGLTPKDNPTAWGLFVAEGAPGKDGATGPVGPNGRNGEPGAIHCILGAAESDDYAKVLYVVPGANVVSDALALVTQHIDVSTGESYEPGDLIVGELSTGDTAENSEFLMYGDPAIANIYGGNGGLPIVFVKCEYEYGYYHDQVKNKQLKDGDKAIFIVTEIINTPYVTPFTEGSILFVTIQGEPAGSGYEYNIATDYKILQNGRIRYATITNPATATEGELTEDQMQALWSSDENKIVFDKEIYSLQDDEHDEGYKVYTHVGHNSQNRFVIKCITVNTNNSTWVLTQHSLGNNYINLGNGSTTNGELTKTEWETINDNPDSKIEYGDDVYTFVSSGSSPLPWNAYSCVTGRKLNTSDIAGMDTKYLLCYQYSGGANPIYYWKFKKQGQNWYEIQDTDLFTQTRATTVGESNSLITMPAGYGIGDIVSCNYGTFMIVGTNGELSCLVPGVLRLYRHRISMTFRSNSGQFACKNCFTFVDTEPKAYTKDDTYAVISKCWIPFINENPAMLYSPSPFIQQSVGSIAEYGTNIICNTEEMTYSVGYGRISTSSTYNYLTVNVIEFKDTPEIV